MKGDGCSQDLLRNHLVKNVICSGVINGKAKTLNSLNKFLTLDREDDSDQLFVNDVMVVTRDVMGINGVIHIIEDVLVPESARNVHKALEESDRNTLKELMEVAGITEGIEELSNVTFFAPSEKALEKLDSSEMVCP